MFGRMQLFATIFSSGSSGPAPALTSLSYDLADTAGGDSITITGTDLDSATSCTVGGTSATITANTSTSLTFTMPAKTAGNHNVQVTTPAGSSNTLSIEAWSPANATSATILHRWRLDTGVTEVSGKVSVLEDSVGMMHQRQTNAGNRYTFNASDAAYNNKPTMSSSATAEFMNADADTAITAAVSMLIVGHIHTATKSFIGIGGAPHNMLWRQGGSDLTANVEFYTTAGGIDGAANGYIATPGSFLVTDTGTGAGDALKIYQGDMATASGSGTTRWSSTTAMHVGRGSAGVGYLMGTFAEGAIWSGVLDATDRAKLEKYVEIRYGIT